ncbi:hypothetical protein [Sphingomonas immobilis]|uniref:Uncharacterized protein n=1 Tax=Sphingomonas immobilis TaxID=3063997 RepID=A0ABT9A1B6_9SPHN|nr:hypothetical protein [Sphingomonas sp. CA1-15]MDO7843623.1 hypothetical protein [Sphingomonas sp. CA1-15]
MSRPQLLPPGVVPTKSTDLYSDVSDPFSWGLRPEQDHILTGPLPEDPSAIETLNVWFFDSARNIAFNIHPILQSGSMFAMVTVFLPDGRILRQRADEAALSDNPQIARSKHVELICDVPFRKWTYAIEDLPVWATDKEALVAGVITDETATTTVTLVAQATMVAPIYMQGGLLPEAAEAVAGEAGLWLAARLPAGMSSESYRFDQMFHAMGHLRFEGKSYDFDGYGLRGHVRGVRKLGGMAGHTWLAGVFPSGTAFGIQTFPRPDGGFFFSEGYVYKDGIMYPNRVLDAPRMSYDPDQGDYAIELACDQLGLTRIVGRDKRLFWWSMPAWGTTHAPRWGIDPEATMVMRQAVTEYTLDGETGYGMNERSGPR